MMRWFKLVKIFFLSIFFISSYEASSQSSLVDSAETSSLHNAIGLYHQFLSPETGLYSGSEYAYTFYYPFTIHEGHPFFLSKQFDTGSVFYNNVLYENVPLLYDLIMGELITRDPTNEYAIRLNNERIGWFILSGHTFIKINRQSSGNIVLHQGLIIPFLSHYAFYDLLYNGTTALYKKPSKNFKEVSDIFVGIKKYVVESNEYFIEKNHQYYKIKNKKDLLLVMNNNKKAVEQFIKQNKLSLKKDKDNALKKIAAYYDSINNTNTQKNN
ncbi:MAG: hypothetical protein ABJA71_10340 [Ginsengibacter sp.]